MIDRDRDDWLPDHTSPGPEAKAVLFRAGQYARMFGTGWIGVEMVWLAAREGDADVRDRLIAGIRRVLAEDRGLGGTFLRASPRIVRLLRDLPDAFSLEQLLAAIRRRAGTVLRHALEWEETEPAAQQFTQATLDIGAARSVPNALEVLGGPDDGTLVRLAPGESIGGAGAGYVVRPLPKGGLPIEVIRWCGHGRVAAVENVDRWSADGFDTRPEPVLGEVDVAVGDVLEIRGGMRFRAVSHIADLSQAVAPAVVSSTVPPNEIALRYTLIRPLGRGGMGLVYDAVDTLSGDRVAVKLIRSWTPAQVSAARREQVALRWLKLPGVVSVHDDGVEGGWWFVAMDYVDGGHFPVRGGPVDWDSLAYPIWALLEVLGRVHAAGVNHLDLKPENALFTASRRVILLDFGLAVGTAVHQESVLGSGTPAYMAPEQVAGLPCDERADIYALGVMLYEGLAGRVPHQVGSRAEALAGRASSGVALLRDKRKDVPDRVIQTIDAMLSVDPGARPATCADVARGLFGTLEPFADHEIGIEGPFAPPAAEGLFHGPEAFFHLPSDGARALHRRSDGDGRSARSELGAWIRGGLATWDGDQVRTDRESLARLELLAPLRLGSGYAPEREVVERMRSSRLDEVVRTLPAQIREDIDASRLERGMALAHLGLVMAREVPDQAMELRLLLLHVEAAAEIATLRALDLLIYELGRTTLPDITVHRLRAVGRAVVTSRNGERERTADLLRGVEEFTDPTWDPIEILRRDVLVRIGALPYDGHETWATTAARQHQATVWLGRLAYREGRWADGMQIFGGAAVRAQTPSQRISCGIYAAMCALEAGDLEGARVSAETLAGTAYRLRLCRLEAEAILLDRNAAYRKGDVLQCEQGLASAAHQVSWNTEGRYAVLEACVAWRAGDRVAQAQLVRTAVIRTRATQPGGGHDLVCALACAMGEGDEDMATRLVERADTARYPEWSLQIVGLINMSRGGREDDLRRMARAFAQRVTQALPAGRMDILSVQECITGNLATPVPRPPP